MLAGGRVGDDNDDDDDGGGGGGGGIEYKHDWVC